MVRRILAVCAASLITATIAVFPTERAAAASISFSPTSGPVGTSVTVTGSGFTPGFPPCEIHFAIDPNKPVDERGGTPP
jgi:hypothetical protein